MSRTKALAAVTIALITPFVIAPSGAQDLPPARSLDGPRKPLIYRSEASGLLFLVESDGRHVVAVDPKGSGEVLWCRDPFADAGLKLADAGLKYIPDRKRRAFISHIGDPGARARDDLLARGKMGRWVGIVYHSGHFGFVSEATGEFHFGGND